MKDCSCEPEIFGDSSICLKNYLNHSISYETILKQGFNCKIPNLSFQRAGNRTAVHAYNKKNIFCALGLSLI